MSVTRIVLEGLAVEPGEVVIPPPAAHHARVARVAAGDPIEVLDLAGTVGSGRLLAWQGASCRVAIDTIERERGEPRVPVVLALGVLHTTAFDWAVEKATELGASAIVPLVTARVQGGGHRGRVARWERVAAAAVAQCGRSRPPAVREPIGYSEFVAAAAGVRYLAEPGAQPPAEAVQVGQEGVVALVGPEGGLTEAEVATALQAGFLPLGLGPRTLRAETAAVAALAVVQDRLARLARA